MRVQRRGRLRQFRWFAVAALCTVFLSSVDAEPASRTLRLLNTTWTNAQVGVDTHTVCSQMTEARGGRHRDLRGADNRLPSIP